MERKVIRLLTFFALLLLCAALLSTAAAEEKNEVTASGTCGPDLTWVLENGTLTISGTGRMYENQEDGVPWHDFREQIVSVDLPQGLTSIGRYSFKNCINLTSVTIPNSVTSIGGHAFFKCYSLASVTIPEGVTRIGGSAFYKCSSLESVTIPSGVTKIDSGVFYGCSSLTSVTISEGVTSIGFEAFEYCSSLTSVTIPSSVTSIGEYAFGDCRILKTIRFEGNAPAIAETAFTDVTADAYCSADNATWTEDVCRHYGGNITWNWCLNGEIVPKLFFTDIGRNEYYYDAVVWAYYHEPQIVAGTGGRTFKPDASCTRAQAITLLWNALGKPKPTTTENPFTDVKAGEYYYKAVLWARENGITGGTSETTFGPDDNCTRAQVITFLWNAVGKPEPTTTENPFTDVKAGKYYYKAVLWAWENGITRGTSETTFSPKAVCTRAQVVTFLYREMGE